MSFKCAAREQGSAGGSYPPDCDWPGCGCDPHASSVISALEEAGHLGSKVQDAVNAALLKSFVARLGKLTFSSRDPLFCWRTLTDLSREARELIESIDKVK